LGKRVALLARPGIACDRLRGALADAGAQVVLEADPLTLDPATLDAAQAQVVMVALDAQTEEAIERFETALQDPSIEVIFEESDLAAKREGWEAARWVRHLSAKLHGHGDVLPPGGEAASEPATSAGTSPEDIAFGIDLDTGTAPGESFRADAPHAFDPLLAEMSFDEIEGGNSRPLTGDVGTLADTPSGAPAAFDTDLDFSYGSFDMAAPASDAAAGLETFDFNQVGDLPMDDLTIGELRNEPVAASQERSFDQMFDGDFVAAASGSDTAVPAVSEAHEADSSPASQSKGGSKLVLELESTDDGAPALRGYSEPSGETSQADKRFKHDLASLETRIAGMELVNDQIDKGPAQASGAVLVMAGIGGPDAVRQLLGALPKDFPRPVLVQQRLDGGRYDKLVSQMQRATALPVKLAESGLPATGGAVYIMPANVGVKFNNGGIQFTAGTDDVLAVLPSADSAVLLLSGSDPTLVDAVMNHSWAGALVIGQAPDGCYDAAAPSELVARGGESGQPAELARRLAERWRS
jgi:chemosensory pili system protein ChpB (putative protein-glutamate methylesterase)